MLDISNLEKSYGSVRALSGVSLQVRDGEIVGFVGANGAGKSTTMRIAMGLLAADAGQVRFREQPLSFATRLRMGYMPESRGLYPKMRIVDQVAYFGELRGMTADDARASAARLIHSSTSSPSRTRSCRRCRWAINSGCNWRPHSYIDRSCSSSTSRSRASIR